MNAVSLESLYDIIKISPPQRQSAASKQIPKAECSNFSTRYVLFWITAIQNHQVNFEDISLSHLDISRYMNEPCKINNRVIQA